MLVALCGGQIWGDTSQRGLHVPDDRNFDDRATQDAGADRGDTSGNVISIIDTNYDSATLTVLITFINTQAATYPYRME